MSFMVMTETFGDVAVIRPQGYLNNIVGEKLEKECNECINRGMKALVLDFSKVEFINSIGISILLSIMETLGKSNGKLCFSSLSSAHKDTFDMLGLTKYAQIFKNESEALRFFNTEAGK